MKQNKRLTVFVFYDKTGKMSEHDRHNLVSLSESSDRVIVVVNGLLAEDDEFHMREKGVDIFIRKNEGYDAGAYKWLFSDVLKREELFGYDELVLTNNTYYGPFYPWKAVFSQFDDQILDFWGLTKHEGCVVYRPEPYEVTTHIQSYFLAVRSRMFLSDAFWDFWSKMPVIEHYFDAIIHFEAAFTRFFCERGFVYDTFINERNVPDSFLWGINPSIDKCDEIVIGHRFPILKKKAFSVLSYSKAKKCRDHIKEEYMYMIPEPLSLVISDNGYTIEELTEFVKGAKNIYIYGNGRYARSLSELLSDLNVPVKGFIVSDNREERGALQFDEVRFESGDAVICGLGIKAFCSAYPNLMYLKKNVPFLFQKDYLIISSNVREKIANGENKRAQR